MKIGFWMVTGWLLFVLPGRAGNGGGVQPTVAVPAKPAVVVSSEGEKRESEVKQIETFTRSVLPGIIAAQSGDDSDLAFLKDKVTYFDSLRQECAAAKATRVESTAVIKKLDPSEIIIDSVKQEARVNVTGNLISGGASTPMLWIVHVKMPPSGAARSYAIQKILAAKLPGADAQPTPLAGGTASP